MSEYKRDRSRVDKAVRDSGVVVVMNKKHVKTPQDMITTMWEVAQAGYVAECTFRIDEGILREAMGELRNMREQSPADKPFLLAGQSKGMLGGMRGAAEYEKMLLDRKVMERRGPGMLGMDSQSAVHLFMVVLIIFGNLAYFLTRKK